MRAGVGKWVPPLMRRTIKSLLTRTGNFEPRLLPLGIDKVRQDDCFLASYPKSGNTWIRFILASLLSPKEEISFRNVDRYVPDPERVDFSIEDLRTRRVIKTHWPFFDLFPKAIYLVRDPRDVFISYYKYAYNNGWYQGDLEGFGSFRAIYGEWEDHVAGALREMRVRPAQICFVKYEDLLSKPIEEVRTLALFLNLVRSPDEIASAVKRNSFRSLQAKERLYGSETGTSGDFFRKGTAGQWRHDLSRVMIEELTERWRPLLECLGYELL